MQCFIIGVVFRCQKPAFRVRHLAEVVFDEFGEIVRGLDLVQRPEAAWMGVFGGAAIAEGGWHVFRSGIGAFVTGDDVAVTCADGVGCGGWGFLCFAGNGFALVAESFGFQTVDLLYLVIRKTVK